MPQEAISVKIARQFVERATEQRMKKGSGRDKAALEFVLGAVGALRTLEPEEPKYGANIAEQIKNLEMCAFMVSSRGFRFLEELATKDKPT